MKIMMLAMLGWPEIVAILVIVLILFGAKKVPELMKGLGQGIKEFKKASREVQEEIQREIESEPPPPKEPQKKANNNSQAEPQKPSEKA
ncbi:MAG: twin-arginine translocase TatA/TatE family subunit [Verrucomicrobiae bacterium]|nr:twin-arginine translocase TatA/TatE family subunit [Verrucomicrobiae bacterium]